MKAYWGLSILGCQAGTLWRDDVILLSVLGTYEEDVQVDCVFLRHVWELVLVFIGAGAAGAPRNRGAAGAPRKELALGALRTVGVIKRALDSAWVWVSFRAGDVLPSPDHQPHNTGVYVLPPPLEHADAVVGVCEVLSLCYVWSSVCAMGNLCSVLCAIFP